jgi:hypothetical protein
MVVVLGEQPTSDPGIPCQPDTVLLRVTCMSTEEEMAHTEPDAGAFEGECEDFCRRERRAVVGQCRRCSTSCVADRSPSFDAYARSSKFGGDGVLVPTGDGPEAVLENFTVIPPQEWAPTDAAIALMGRPSSRTGQRPQRWGSGTRPRGQRPAAPSRPETASW